MNRLTVCLAAGTDPRENLAAERLLMESALEGELILFLWQNRHTVVIGRNQNAWRECRTEALRRDGGTLVRRLSGGGAVYHDLGNLNFTFCARTASYDLSRQQSILVEACRLLGIRAQLSGRNDLLAEGRKFSGNSFYTHGGYAFHNGTLLIDTDFHRLERYLTPPREKLEGKGIDSVRSRVVNLRELRPDLTVEQMRRSMAAAAERVCGVRAEPFQEERWDRRRLETLKRQFSSWSWTYGETLPFTFSCSRRFSWGSVTLECLVREGILLDNRVYSDAMDASFGEVLSGALRSCRFEAEELCGRIAGLPLEAGVREDLCGWLREQEI